MRFSRPLALLFSAAALAVAAAGCGGGGDNSSSSTGTDPDEWASSVCGALQTWEDDLESESRQLSADLRSSSDLKSVKQKLVTFLEDAKASTAKMVSDVKAAGAPDVKDGVPMEKDLEASLTVVQASFARAVKQAKKLPTNNPQKLTTGLSTLAQTIQSELTATGKHFSDLEGKYDVSDLNEAMKGEPACKPFISQSG